MILMNYFPVMNIRNLLGHRYLYLWLAELWTLFIAFLCLESSKNLPSIGIKAADKYVHFTFHFVFVVLWSLYFIIKQPENRNTIHKTVLRVFIASVLYGILIEIAQGLFTKTRGADIFDVFANSTGSVFGAFAILLYTFYLFKKKSEI